MTDHYDFSCFTFKEMGGHRKQSHLSMSFLPLLDSLHAGAALAGACPAHTVHVHERDACVVDGSSSFTLHVLHACMAFTSESILT